MAPGILPAVEPCTAKAGLLCKSCKPMVLKVVAASAARLELISLSAYCSSCSVPQTVNTRLAPKSANLANYSSFAVD